MRHRLYRQAESQDAFTDVLFNVLLGFALMFIASLVLMQDPRDEGKTDPKAEILITIRWPDGHPDDVDTLVEGPRGDLLWYNNRDTALMHLDRDDRGLFADRVMLTHYGPEPIAASMPAGLTCFTFMSLFIGTAGYTNTFVAQYTGAGERKRVGLAVWQGLWVAVFGGIIVALTGLAAVPIFEWI